MSYTKDQLVHGALEEIGIASYDFDIPPEASESALRRLDSMMMEWDGRGIYLNYPFGNPGETSLSEDSGIPAFAWEAVITNLAVRLAPSYGKNVSSNTMITAKRALNAVLSKLTMPRKRQLDTLPSGAGHKKVNSFIVPVADTHLDDVDTELQLGDQDEL